MRTIFLFPLAMHSSDNLIDVYWADYECRISVDERKQNEQKTKANAK